MNNIQDYFKSFLPNFKKGNGFYIFIYFYDFLLYSKMVLILK